MGVEGVMRAVVTLLHVILCYHPVLLLTLCTSRNALKVHGGCSPEECSAGEAGHGTVVNMLGCRLVAHLSIRFVSPVQQER